MILYPADIQKILGEINSDSEVLRRKQELFNKEIYDGGLKKAVKARMMELFPKTGHLYTIFNYNLHKKITNKKSKAYKRPPSRKLSKDTETDAYKKILTDFNFDDAMKLMDLYKNRHQYCGLGIIRNRKMLGGGKKKDIYSFWALAPYEFCVHRDPNDEIYAWSLPAGRDKEFSYWTIWSAGTHIKVKTKDYKDFEIVPNLGNPNNVNPYGVIPFIYVPIDASGFYPETAPLPEQTVELNTSISIYLTAANMQIGQRVIEHPKKQIIEDISHGLMTAISLPQEDGSDKKPTKISYLTPTSDLAGQKEAIQTALTMIFDENDVNGNSALKNGESFTSGFDRLLANADVQEVIEDNQDLYSRCENEAYKIILAMNKRDQTYLFTSEMLKLTYLKPKILSSDTEKLNNLEKKKNIGLWEEWELLQEKDPNLTDEEAKAIASERQALKALDAKNVFNGAQVTSLVEVVVAATTKQMPIESAVNIIISSFGMTEEQARKILPANLPTKEPEESFSRF